MLYGQVENEGDQAPAKLGQFQGVDLKNPIGIGKKGTFLVLIFLIILAFLAGNFLGDSSSDKELERKFQQEQQTILEVIRQKDAEIMRLQADRANERDKRQSDSIRLMGVIEGKERANKALLKENERINYKKFTNPDLDSIDAILFGSR